MLIKDLPIEIQELVFKRQEEQGNPEKFNGNLSLGKGSGNFKWEETEEGMYFWSSINNGDFTKFYEKYPKKEANMFKKGDYIVSLRKESSDWVKYNHCYIHNGKNPDILYTDKDSLNEVTSSSNITFKSDKWRYATPEEIAEYDRLGKPYDVTTLNKQKDEALIGRYIKALSDRPSGGDVLKDEVGIVVLENTNYLNADFPSQKGYHILKSKLNMYELLPKDYKPMEELPYIDGNWYIVTDGIDRGCVIKFDKKSSTKDSTYFYEGFQDNKKYTWKKGNWCFHKCTLEPFDITQYLHLFPIDHELYKPMTYQHSPIPTDGKEYFKARVVRDIIKKDIRTYGFLPDIIPAGSITWFHPSYKKYISHDEECCPENNRFSANIPGYYFEIIEDEPKFIVGKWYKNTKNCNYGKLTSPIPSDKSRFPSTEYIDCGEYYNDGTSYSRNWMDNLIEADLSEIQAYLPEGHPDKVFKFEKNGYYVGTWNDGGKHNRYIFKTTEGKLDHPNPGIDAVDQFKRSSFCTGSGIKFKLANEEERAWLDACIKADKSISLNDFRKMHKKIEKGMLVRCIGDGKSQYGSYAGAGWEKDLEFIVKKVDDYVKYSIVFGGKKGQGVYSDCIEVIKASVKTGEIDMQVVQAECKKKFPIGCTFKNTVGETYTLEDDSAVYQIINTRDTKQIYAHGGAGLLYKDGKFATLIEQSSPQMTPYILNKEELLAEAARRFPINTKFIGLGSKSEEIAIEKPYDYGSGIAVKPTEGVVLYWSTPDKWASIIQQEKPSVDNIKPASRYKLQKVKPILI